MAVQEKKFWGRKVLTVVVLAVLALLAAVNLRVVKGPLVRLAGHEIGFEDFVAEVQKGYLSNSFVSKNGFVNLNGLFARLTGRRVLNETVKCENGTLGRVIKEDDIGGLVNNIRDFSEYLSEYEKIPFLYIQMPFKESLEGQYFPEGTVSYGNRMADSLLHQLSAEGVETMDLRPMLSRTPEMIQQYFYKTDHHWNSDGAFVAFQAVLERLQEMFPEAGIDLTYAQREQWERHEMKDWFLGSLGKRVGQFFGGVDSLIWYTPRFETEMSCAVLKYGQLYRGNFTEANIRPQYIEKRNYFDNNAYCVYIGGDYPVVQHRNLFAPSPLRILMIKDSFTLPLQAYLSTVFQEVDVIDPRHLSECSAAEYAERMKPDVVIFSINASVFGGEPYQNFGTAEVVSAREQEYVYEAVVQRDIAIEAKEHNYNYDGCNIEPNTTYRVTFDCVDILEGRTDSVGLRVYNRTAETTFANTMFDLAYCEAAGGFTWTFRTPDTQDELQLLFYAGGYGSTAGNSVVYRNVVLEKYVPQ